jgi:hypothetical protein
MRSGERRRGCSRLHLQKAEWRRAWTKEPPTQRQALLLPAAHEAHCARETVLPPRARARPRSTTRRFSTASAINAARSGRGAEQNPAPRSQVANRGGEETLDDEGRCVERLANSLSCVTPTRARVALAPASSKFSSAAHVVVCEVREFVSSRRSREAGTAVAMRMRHARFDLSNTRTRRHRHPGKPSTRGLLCGQNHRAWRGQQRRRRR